MHCRHGRKEQSAALADLGGGGGGSWVGIPMLNPTVCSGGPHEPWCHEMCMGRAVVVLPSPPPPGWCWVFKGAKSAEENFGQNQLAPKASEKIFDWPKARRI